MSDLMFYGVLQMPYELAMEGEISRFQFYYRVQEAVERLKKAEELADDYSDYLRGLCCSLSVGGWNSEGRMSVETADAKIQDGLKMLVAPWVERAMKAEARIKELENTLDLAIISQNEAQSNADRHAGEATQLRRVLEIANNERDHWKANHGNLAMRLKIATERPDLPVDRIPAIKELERLQELERSVKAFAAINNSEAFTKEAAHKAFASLAQNQCDGCMQGAPINERGNHVDGKGKAFMSCQAHRYAEPRDISIQERIARDEQIPERKAALARARETILAKLLAEGYECGTMASAPDDLGGTIHLHYQSPAEAEAAFAVLTDALDKAIKHK